MKTRTVTIPKKDVLFDVDAVTHIFARANEGDDVRHGDALSADTLETFGANVITRYADRRAAELSDLLARFLTPATSTATSVAISSATSYVYSFLVEDRFQDELLEALGNDMESYIATGAAADWFYATGNSQGPAYAQMLVPKLNEIMSMLVKRKFPARTYPSTT